MKWTFLLTVLVCVSVGGVVVGGDDSVNSFEAFKSSFEKRYVSLAEDSYRRVVFEENMKRAAVENEKAAGSAVYGATQFSDLTPEEFRGTYGRLMPEVGSLKDRSYRSSAPRKLRAVDAVTSFDWTNSTGGKGLPYNTTVYDQGTCGSCWAFASMQALEAYQMIFKNRPFLSLSVQQFIECAGGTAACNGGRLSDALVYLRDHGLMPYSEYCRSYCEILTGVDECRSCYPVPGPDPVPEPQPECTACGDCTDCCDVKCNATSLAAVTNRTTVPYYVMFSDGEDGLISNLLEFGPIMVSIASSWMQTYISGVAAPSSCGTVDHAVLLVGFGETGGTKYWKIKNSWGPSVGEGGYYYLKRGNDLCGIETNAFHITSEEPDNRDWWEKAIDWVLDQDYQSTEFLVASGVILAIVIVIFTVVLCCFFLNVFCGSSGCIGTSSFGGSSAGCCGGGAFCCKRAKTSAPKKSYDMELEISSDLYSRDGKVIY